MNLFDTSLHKFYKKYWNYEENMSFHFKKAFFLKSYFFLSHFFKTLALKISAVNWCKKNIFISTYVEFYREQGHIHFLTMHWKIWAADAKKYFFEGLSVYMYNGVCISKLDQRTFSDIQQAMKGNIQNEKIAPYLYF